MLVTSVFGDAPVAFDPHPTPAPYGHPEDVLADPRLADDQRRAILASWASDRRAVPDRPGLRQLDSGAVVPVETILAALKSLDDATPRAIVVPLRRRDPTHPEDDPSPPACAARAAHVPAYVDLRGAA